MNTVQSLYDAMFGVNKNGPCYKGIILQREDRKMTILWSFSYTSFEKFQDSMEKILGKLWYIQICLIMRCAIKRLHCTLCEVHALPVILVM